jgi:CheY-like chemotaxis protein
MAFTQVLIVDDDPDVSDVLREIVDTYGYQAFVTNSAKEAAAILAKEKIRLILLDLAMPGITGDQFLEFIRKQGFQVPVVVVSAHVDEEREKSLRAAGISGIVKKPFEVGQVIDEMEKALG